MLYTAKVKVGENLDLFSVKSFNYYVRCTLIVLLFEAFNNIYTLHASQHIPLLLYRLRHKYCDDKVERNKVRKELKFLNLYKLMPWFFLYIL